MTFLLHFIIELLTQCTGKDTSFFKRRSQQDTSCHANNQM